MKHLHEFCNSSDRVYLLCSSVPVHLYMNICSPATMVTGMYT